MGVVFSCPLWVYCDLEDEFESIHQEDNRWSDKGKENESTKLLSLDSGKSMSVGSFRFRPKQTRASEIAEPPMGCSWGFHESPSPLSRSGSLTGKIPESSVLDPSSPKHEAAIKLQKVYKSFRTRRKLADCAVLIEQSWLKLLDFAELKHSSISFFDMEKHETATSRWSRARTRAAKVGKGLSKNSKAQKLALQHWLEAIDPRHRYGHNLHFYYMKWLNSQSREPFFYWLDIGEAKEVNLIEKCPRLKLQQQCIKYLGPMERKPYEVGVENGKLFYKEGGELLDTIQEPKGCKWIFVLSTSRTLYVGKKKKGSFQHSSFLSGGATLAAGRIVAEKGVLKAVWPHSGHYQPTPENFQDLISYLRENNVDLIDVALNSTDDDDDKSVRKHVRNSSSEDDLILKETEENDSIAHISKIVDSGEEENGAAVEIPKLRSPQGSSKMTALMIPSRDDLMGKLKNEKESVESTLFLESETKKDLANEETITEDSVLQRINSHKEMKSYQLGKQLSCRWSTGAGPRIGCLRDYPSGLQSHALEQVNLSPRSERRLRVDFPSRASSPRCSNLFRSNSESLGHTALVNHS